MLKVGELSIAKNISPTEKTTNEYGFLRKRNLLGF